MEPTIREARYGDLSIVHRIEIRNYSDPWPISLFHLMYGRAHDFFLIAELAGQVIGYAIGEIEWSEVGRIGHILNIAIDEKVRRQHIASKLMDEIERRFTESNLKKAYLEVRVSNTAAQELYKKRNYKKTGILTNYYRNEDGLKMEKVLS